MTQKIHQKKNIRVFVEATFTFESGLHSGIQRVVRKIVEPLVAGSASAPGGGVGPVIPVTIDARGMSLLDVVDVKPRGKLQRPEEAGIAAACARGVFRAGSAAARVLRKAVIKTVPISAVKRYVLAPRWQPGLSGTVRKAIDGLSVPVLSHAIAPDLSAREEKPRERLLRGVDFEPGDVLILLDSSWHIDFWAAIEELKAAGVKCVFVVYDLIPLLHQEVVTPGLRDVFIRWIERTMQHADGYVAISRAVADEMRDFLARYGSLPGGRDPSTIPVGWFHLGAEIAPRREAKEVRLRAQLRSAKLKKGSYYLMVGTLEPRKRHRMVIEAFERLWSAGFQHPLVLVGVWGWLSEDERRYIEWHPELGKRLFHFKDVRDVELLELYGESRAIIQASLAEGFGLPIIEAAFHGKRVICTDLPVFREVAAPGTLFFERDSLDAMVTAIEEEASLPASTAGDGVEVRLTSWDESRRQLLAEAVRLASSETSLRAVPKDLPKAAGSP